MENIEIENFDLMEFFLKMREERDVAFLHTGRNTEGEHWSIIAWNPVKHAGSYEELRERDACESGDVPFCGGWIGYFSYDMPAMSANYYEDFLCFDGEKIFTSAPKKVREIWGRRPRAAQKFGIKF